MRIMIIHLLLGLVVLIPEGAVPVETGPQKIVAAHFMPQMSVGVPGQDCDDPLKPLDCRPDGVMAAHSEAYRHAHRSPLRAAREDVAQARRCGINAFNMLLGPFMINGDEGAKATCYSEVIHGLYQAVGETEGFTIAPEIWDPLKADGRTVGRLARGLGVLGRWSSARGGTRWTAVEGKALVLLRVTGNPREAVAYEEGARELFRELGGREKVYLVLYLPNPSDPETVPSDWVRGADALTYWPNFDYALTVKNVSAAEEFAEARRKPLIRAVMPGFAQSRPGLAPTPPNVREKLGMTNFLADWAGVLRSGSSTVFIDTFNDLSEDSAVADESNHGRAYEKLNAILAGRFREGSPRPPEKESVFLFHHPQRCRDTALPAGVPRMGSLTWAWTQPTDYVGVVADLKAPATIEVSVGGTILGRRTLRAGLNAWLLYAPAKAGAKAARGAQIYPGSARPPLDLPDLGFFAQELTHQSFGPKVSGEVAAVVARDGAGQTFKSHRPIEADACRGELTTVGDVFELDRP